MKNNNSKNVIIILLLAIIVIILVSLGILFKTGIISFNSDVIDKQQNENIIENEKNDKENSSIIKITLPSNETISINKEYQNIFNDSEKIIATSNGENDSFKESDEPYTSELTLSELIKKELEGYPDDFYTGKKVSVSSTLFDFDNDNINEIIFSLGEEYILLRYYNEKVYGYVLPGYRSNGSWRVNGTSIFSGSVLEWGIFKYSFDGSKLNQKVLAASEREDPLSSDDNIIYKVNDKIVSKTEFDSFISEKNEIALIEYVDYSSN